MANKRGRPRKLPPFRIKEFDRQFREARIPAFLVDRELTVVYANDYACAAFPGADRPEGLRVLLSDRSREECVRRIAQRESFRLSLPSMVGVHAVIAVTPVAGEGDDQAAGAMVLVTCPDRPEDQGDRTDDVAALSGSMRPLVSDIFNCLTIMGQRARAADPKVRPDEYLQVINRSSYLLLRNLKNLDSYHRRFLGDQGKRIEVVDFWAHLAPILDACEIVLHGSEIPFRYQLPDKSFVAHVSCCPQEVDDALMNLISNAYCHTRPGNQVEVIGRNVKNGVVVTVSDQGRGIAPDQMDSIFSPFYSDTEDSGPHRRRLGLGLTVARQNILLNGGTLAIDSTPGKGTSVAFTLPTCDDPLTPPLIMASGTVEYLLDRLSDVYIGLCDFATLPPQ